MRFEVVVVTMVSDGSENMFTRSSDPNLGGGELITFFGWSYHLAMIPS